MQVPAGAARGARRLPAARDAERRSRCTVPALDAFAPLLEGTGRARDLDHDGLRAPARRCCCKDKEIGQRVVPIVPDEARTFGMEGLFRQIGIYSSVGQLYEPQDADQLMYYREDKKGQILEEGINEAGAMCSLDRGRHGLREPRRQP